MHVEFDELTAMASEQYASRPVLQLVTPRIISSGLMQNPSSPTPYSVVSLVPAAATLRPADLTDTFLSTSIDQDAPSASTSPSTETQIPVISQCVEE
ncbi:hypothetical protein Tco_1129933 [Tanacetum coccineum]